MKTLSNKEIAKAINKSPSSITYKKKHFNEEYKILGVGYLAKKFLDENNNNVLNMDIDEVWKLFEKMIDFNTKKV